MTAASRGGLSALTIAVAAALAAWPGAGANLTASPQQPTFRAGSSAVMVDVTVHDGRRRAITGLTPQDFHVLDNGVPQEVSNLSYGKLPIDVTVALDVSFSVTGGLLARLRDGVRDLMGDLGAEDRLKLVLFNMRVNRTADFTRDVRAVERAIREAAAGGGTALFDAISVALVSSAAPERRQLIVFFSDGSDSVSATTPETLKRVAERTRATLTFVMPGQSTMLTTAPIAGTAGSSPVAIGGYLTAAPGAARPGSIFSTLAAETGGSVVPIGVSTDLTATFKRILAEFRSTYVLYYNARGVDPAGYHTIDVKVNREHAVVQSRRGYFGSQ